MNHYKINVLTIVRNIVFNYTYIVCSSYTFLTAKYASNKTNEEWSHSRFIPYRFSMQV